MTLERAASSHAAPAATAPARTGAARRRMGPAVRAVAAAVAGVVPSSPP